MAANATLGPTIGLFTVPTTGEAQFDQRIGGRLGFTKLSKTVVPDTQTTATSNTAATTGGGTSAATSTSDNNTTGNKGTVTLYVWNQNAKSILTLEKRRATKVGVMESIVYPGHTTK